MGVPGGYTGWVQGGYSRVGTGEGYTGYPACCSGRGISQRSGPRKPLQGAGVGGDIRAGWAGPGTTTAWPGRSLQALPVPGPLNAASWPIRRDLTSVPGILVKTAKCHQNMSKRPPIVPNSKNGPQKSPLEIPGISFSLAFSHKELMGVFCPDHGLYCQNDEVSTVCTRRVRSDTPTGHGSKLPSVTRSSSDLGAGFI